MTFDLSGKAVLVTGAAGFIGSHLCEQLLKQGAMVTGVDNFLTGHQGNVAHLADNPNFQLLEADVTTDPNSYLPAGVKFELILHFASPASPPKYQAAPVATYLVNSYATHLLLTYLKDSNPEGRFLFASTSEVYGDPEWHPQSEDYWGNVNPNGLRSCYDESKRLGETICGVHARDFGLDTRIVRIFNTYGPRLDPDDGRVISSFIRQAKAGQKLTIYGDGSHSRSYCYVDDLVAGVLKFVSLDNLAGETINLGNPEELTVKQTAEVIFQLVQGRAMTDQDFELSQLPADDPVRRQPDISKALKLLNWQPQVNFTDGIKRTTESFQVS